MATERISLGFLWEEKLLSLDPYGNKKYCPWIPMAREVIVLGSLWQEKLLSLDPYGKRSFCPWIPMATESIAHGSLWQQKYCPWIPMASKVLQLDPCCIKCKSIALRSLKQKKVFSWITMATESIAPKSLWQQKVRYLLPLDPCGKRKYFPGSLWQQKVLPLNLYSNRKYCPLVATESIITRFLYQ